MSALAEQKTGITDQDEKQYADACGNFVGIKADSTICAGSPSQQIYDQGMNRSTGTFDTTNSKDRQDNTRNRNQRRDQNHK